MSQRAALFSAVLLSLAPARAHAFASQSTASDRRTFSERPRYMSAGWNFWSSD
jgi:hypothetical protein